MNTTSRTVTGVALWILGGFISVSSYLDKSEDWLFGIAVGVFFFGVGVYIFFNTKEDEIEEIKR